MVKRMGFAKLASILIALFVLVFVFGAFSQTPVRTITEPQQAESEAIELEDWVRNHSQWGITSFKDGELFMRSKLAGYYYVLVAPEEYSSDGSTTEVTLRNINGTPSKYGYGIIFHSNPTPLTQDYAFLIDTTRKRFRVVRHSKNDERAVVHWTDCPFINSGKQENTLDTRDLGSTTELYINGHLVTTIENTYAFKGGVPGLYTDIIIAFKGLTVDPNASLPKFK